MDIRMCEVSLANIMVEPDHRSELHTQLLFGDFVELLDEKLGNWIKIRLEWDGYEGWMLSSQLSTIYTSMIDSGSIHVCNIGINQLNYNHQHIQLFPGTYLPTQFTSDLIQGELIQINTSKPDENAIRSIVSNYIQVPYLWGGVSTAGIDCSGLSQILYRFLGIRLPHVASEQMEFGEILDFIQLAQCGDLAFFENSNGEIKHIGIMLNPSEIIHASESNGRVLIDNIDQEGIISSKTGKRTHQLRVVKRLF